MDLAKRMVEILKAENDPLYFAKSDYFWGLNLWPKQRKTLHDFYEGNYKELVATWGYKSGKTVLAGTFAGYEAFKLLLIPEPAKHFGFVPLNILKCCFNTWFVMFRCMYVWEYNHRRYVHADLSISSNLF